MAEPSDVVVRTVVADADKVRDLQMLLEALEPTLRPGDAVPPLWHWVALARWSDPAQTGADGHPHRPVALGGAGVRRMFAGGTVSFGAAPLIVGEPVEVATEFVGHEMKPGRGGDFTLASFETTVRTPGGQLVLRELQNVVYIGAEQPGHDSPVATPCAVVGSPVKRVDEHSAELTTDPTVLMRFSALTSNGHRIHYDADYAREVEGIPGLLVHGPLMTMAAVHVALAGSRGRKVRSVTHRSRSPLFVGETALLVGVQQSESERRAIVGGAGGNVDRPRAEALITFDD